MDADLTGAEGVGPQCPLCGNPTLPEFCEPSGIVLCVRCGAVLRHTKGALVPVGRRTDLAEIVTRRLREPDSLQERIQDRVIELIAEKRGVSPDTLRAKISLSDYLGIDSLDVVEVVLAIEEEFGPAFRNDGRAV